MVLPFLFACLTSNLQLAWLPWSEDEWCNVEWAGRVLKPGRALINGGLKAYARSK